MVLRSALSRSYAGIGSRQTPDEIGVAMGCLAYVFGRLGITLRTGGAPGADKWFEAGARIGDCPVELYLPWVGFEGRAYATLDYPKPAAYEIARQYHPGWHRLSQGARKLIARNSHQILGENLDDPVELVVCWTPDGSLDGKGRKTGGTGQALRIAHDLGIPVRNMARDDDLRDVLDIAYG